MAGNQQQKKKGGNKHSSNIGRSERKYGRTRTLSAKAGKRKRYCAEYPHCIHNGRRAVA